MTPHPGRQQRTTTASTSVHNESESDRTTRTARTARTEAITTRLRISKLNSNSSTSVTIRQQQQRRRISHLSLPIQFVVSLCCWLLIVSSISSTTQLSVQAFSPSTTIATTTTRTASTTRLLAVTPQSSSSSSTKDTSSSSTSSTSSSSSTTTTSNNNNQKLLGRWEEINGNYLLRPPPEQDAPRALIHFLGGALVGAVPHLSYRYLLEQLAESGYLVVATPYPLQFDHLSTCNQVLEQWERAAVPLAQTYGALPVIGVGHSTGALLQLLITSLFPDTPRAANCLLSYSNLPVEQAVPLLDEWVAPFFTYAVGLEDDNDEKSTEGSSQSQSQPKQQSQVRPNGAQALSTWLELAKSPLEGQVPSNELLTRAAQFLPTPLAKSTDHKKDIQLPAPLRASLESVMQTTYSTWQTTGVPVVLRDVLTALDQIPPLMQDVATGTRDFVPTRPQVQAAARRAYRARNTLLVQYEDDALDESNELYDLLQAASQVIRMKRPMVEIQLQLRTIEQSGHSAPLLAPPSLSVATTAEDLLGPDVARQQLGYRAAYETCRAMTEWLEASNL